jgi:hypothetical protein
LNEKEDVVINHGLGNIKEREKQKREYKRFPKKYQKV